MTGIPLDAGFPLTLQDGQLQMGAGVGVRETKTRTRGELAPVAFEPEACVPADETQYWMYNGVFAAQDATRLQEAPAQYELTVMAAEPLGAELPKTLGHIHDAPEGDAPTFPESYEVLYGTAYFLLYRCSAFAATFCGWVRAGAGEQVVMPPDFYHLTINAGASPLVFADLISKRARGIYDGVRATHGAPYLALRRGEWMRNRAFFEVAPAVECPALRRAVTAPLYTRYVRDPAAFQWLDDPAQFWKYFPQLQTLRA
jgi:oxalate decarboxylase/phosphoglucose isomerase-like protein (cupin superfamily)